MTPVIPFHPSKRDKILSFLKKRSDKLMILLGIISWICVIAAGNTQRNSSYEAGKSVFVLRDSIPGKKYEVRTSFPIESFIQPTSKLDSLDFLLKYVGKSLNKDQYDEIQLWYYSIKYRLLLTARRDSIEIKKPLK